MSGVNFNDPETRFASPERGGGKSGDDVLDAFDGECFWHGIGVCERHCAWCNHIFPSPFTFGDHSMPRPRAVGAGLAARMRELHPRNTALLMNEADDSSQRLNMVV